MENRQIRLTEDELHALIRESVEQVLINEGWWSDIKAGIKPWTSVGKEAASRASQKVGQAAANQYDNARTAVGNAYGRAKNAVGGAYNSAKNAVGNAYNSAAGAVGDAYNSAAGAVGNAYNKAAEVGRSGINASRVSIAHRRLADARQNAIDSLNNYIAAAQKCGGISSKKVKPINDVINMLSGRGASTASNILKGQAQNEFRRNLGLN